MSDAAVPRPDRRFDGVLAARLALAAGLVLALYASLRPFRGWHSAGGSPLSFLAAAWPHTLSAWDVALNIAGYLGLGLAAVLARGPRCRPLASLSIAVGGLSLFSAGMETLQGLLPSRSPSIVDVATNIVGACAGAVLGLMLAPRLAPGGALHGLRQRLLVGGARGDAGLVLLGVWCLALLAPRTLLYANGDLHLLLGVQPLADYPQQLMLLVETVCAVVNLVALALIVRLIAAGERQARWLFLVLVAASIAVRSAAFGVFWTSAAAFHWLTPAAMLGLLVGVPAGLAVMPLPRRPGAAIAGLLLLLSTLIVNISPPNPYLYLTPRPARQHELAPLSMLSRTTAMVWPLAALGFLAWRSPQERTRRCAAQRTCA